MIETPAGQLEHARQQARARLTEAYAQDLLDQDQLDEGLEAVERATSIAELDALTAPLRPPATAALVPVAPAPLAPAPARLRVIFGTLARNGVWSMAATTRVRVWFGNATLDLRQAVVPPGPIVLDVSVTFGSLDIIVPPGWQIDVECGAIFGAVEQRTGPVSVGEDRRTLRLTGRVVFGNITIHERLPGENAWDALKRRRREKKALAQRQARALTGTRE
ncbi:MAG TPA: LiaF domain-containing protein [Nannocystis sp.]